MSNLYWPSNFNLSKLEWYKKFTLAFLSLYSSSKNNLSYRQILKAIYDKYPSLATESGGEFPAKWKIRLLAYRYYHSRIKDNPKLEAFLTKTKTRSLSGIVPLSVFTKGKGCPFNCIYCPTSQIKDIPKSYFADEAAIQRAIRFGFGPYDQVEGRLIMFVLAGHIIDKVDLIIQGGTFSFYDKTYRQRFVKRCFDAANSDVMSLIVDGQQVRVNSKSLKEAQALNEKANSRIIGITIETRPDYINKDELKFLRQLGVTRVELGIQIVDDKILALVERGHGTKEIKQATYLLKEYGFKVTYHLMTNLPGSNPKLDFERLSQVFANPDYRPDYLKVYPTALVKNAKLLDWYRQGKYKPYSQEELVPLLIKFKQEIVPEYVRIQRLVRDLTKNDQFKVLVESHLRQRLHNRQIKCNCIRCREIKDQTKSQIWLKVFGYKASNGIEYFLSFVDEDNRLYGLLRLRILTDADRPWQAVIRELHVYGPTVALGRHLKTASQHKGLGYKLLKKAEKIAKWHEAKKIAVISGVGVRDYYRKLGYELQETYMVKTLKL